MVMRKRRCGSFEIQAVEEWSGLYRDPLEMYPGATPEIVARHRDWLVPEALDAETGLMVFAFQSYLLQTGRYTILVDSCVGEDKECPHRPNWHRKKWPWLDNLKAAGVTPEEVDFVMCTHLHVDHVGWNTRLVDGRWVPTFPNASYLFAETSTVTGRRSPGTSTSCARSLPTASCRSWRPAEPPSSAPISRSTPG